VTLVLLSLHTTEVSNPATAIDFGIGIHNLFPGARLWKTESEVVIRVAGKVHHHCNWVTGSIKAQETQDILVGIAAINPLEASVVMV
jgi:hypothetical protein